MRQLCAGAVFLCAVALAACERGAPIGGAVSSGPTVASEPIETTLRDAQGEPLGTATLRDTPNGVLIRLALRDLPPGEHAFHVHENGVCEAPFESAGDHLARSGREHGFLNEGGPHAGDLPNLVVDQDGRVEKEIFAAGLRFGDFRDPTGAALIVHAGADDYRTQPAGAAGDRIACGEIVTRS